MEWKTVRTHHTPVRYLEAGSGPALVFLHGAGGVTSEDPFLNALAENYHVYAPLIPGYGDSEAIPYASGDAYLRKLTATSIFKELSLRVWSLSIWRKLGVERSFKA